MYVEEYFATGPPHDDADGDDDDDNDHLGAGPSNDDGDGDDDDDDNEILVQAPLNHPKTAKSMWRQHHHHGRCNSNAGKSLILITKATMIIIMIKRILRGIKKNINVYFVYGNGNEIADDDDDIEIKSLPALVLTGASSNNSYWLSSQQRCGFIVQGSLSFQKWMNFQKNSHFIHFWKDSFFRLAADFW